MKETEMAAIINRITEAVPPREAAFFTLMRQSGLTPITIKRLKIQDIEFILDKTTPTPCKINIFHEDNPFFIGDEAISALKKYLATRSNLKPEEMLFTLQNGSNKEINLKNISRAFRYAVEKTQKNSLSSQIPKEREPDKLKLYDLVKFYRKRAKHYLMERKKETKLKNHEYYRSLYEQKALPFLEIETPTKCDLIILRKQHKQLKGQIDEIEKKLRSEFDDWIEENPDELERQEQEYQEHIKWEQEHPEEVKQIQENSDRAAEQYDKYLDEHPEIEEQEQRRYIEHLEERVAELEQTVADIKKSISKTNN